MFRREPSTSTQSAACRQKLPARVPMVPGRPANSGWSEAMRSCVQAVASGMPRRSTSASRRFSVCDSRTPVPPKISGRCAWRSLSAMKRQAARSASVGGLAAGGGGAGICSASADCWMSSGMSSHTGPGRPPVASAYALGSRVGSSCALRTSRASLHTGLAMAMVGPSWSPSWRRPRTCRGSWKSMQVSRLICPERTIIGIESVKAPCTPLSAFTAPGPVVSMTTAGLPVMRA